MSVDVENILHEIRDLVQELIEITDATVPQRVDVGFALTSLGTTIKKANERVKDALRKDAPQIAGDICFDGRYATATVNVPEITFKLSKDADMPTLHRALGSAFEEYFIAEVLVRPRDGFATKLLDLSEEAREMVLRNIEQTQRAGGVTFQRKRP